MLESDGKSRFVGYAANPHEDARHERRAVHRVVPDRQGLPRPAEDDLLVRDHPADAQSVHADPVDVGAPGAVELGAGGVGVGPSPASRRAAAMSFAVRRAVPEGASALSGGAARPPRQTRRTQRPRRRSASSGSRRWRSSGRSARRPPCRRAIPRAASRPSSKPVVPTTAWMPFSMQNRRLSITTSGWVKSTTTWTPLSTSPPMSSPASMAATSSTPSASSTPVQTA